MNDFNRLHISQNPFQGNHKKVLCVCSAGVLRSPSAAVVLSQEPFNYNTRAAGIDAAFALIPVDQVLLAWADEIVCMTLDHERAIKKMIEDVGHQDQYLYQNLKNTPIFCLDIPDSFAYRDQGLMRMIGERYSKCIADHNFGASSIRF